MHFRAFERRAVRRLAPVYLANFFFSLHYALLVFVNSSYLRLSFSTLVVSALFALGALGNILIYLWMPRLLNRMGNNALCFALLILALVTTLSMALGVSGVALAICFVIYESLPLPILYTFDLMLESVSDDRTTGETRGIHLTLGNAAVAIAPLLITALAADGGLYRLYALSALVLIPVIFIWSKRLRHLRNPHVAETALPFHHWAKTKSVRRVSLARLTLDFFYAVMTIFTPIYLIEVMHFDWGTIGFIFAFMLLPFVLFELPAGELADHWCGEKEIMTTGFFIMGVALLIMPFLGPNAIHWAIVLFISRVGATFVEVTTDAYLFKQVDLRETGIIAIYRMTRPLPIILAAILGGLFFAGSPMIIFPILIGATFLGLIQSTRLVDTK